MPQALKIAERLSPLLDAQLVQVVGQLAVDRDALVEVGLRASGRAQALKQLFCQTLLRHALHP